MTRRAEPRSVGYCGRQRTASGRFIATALLLLPIVVSRALAEVTPQRGAVDGRIRSAAYDGEEVYRLRGFIGYQIDLQFEVGEIFVGLGAGDIDGLSYFGQDNHLFLKPKAATVATNLTVLTNRRQYQFDYAVLPQRPTHADKEAMFVLRFLYPAPEPPRTHEPSVRRIEEDLKLASTTGPQNLNYWYCGGPQLKPASVSDDGVHTRFSFTANGELPAIFVRNEDETESLVNYSVDAGDVVVHRIARRFILRRGKLVGCVVNKSYAGGGRRLDSGTVAPRVERRIQRAEP